ncbi:isoprenyl transferase [Niallia sp. Krafla_26]
MFDKLKMRKKTTSPSSLQERIEQVMEKPVPEHIAIIMDGNGRWANNRAMPRIAGHHEGMKVVRKITVMANRLGVKTLTLYAFSTENWKRPKSEVDFLMKLPEEFLGTYLPELATENVKVQTIGYMEQLPPHTYRAVESAKERTKENTGLILNFALNYGSRAEIIEAVKSAINEAQKGILSPEEMNEDIFSNYLMTKGLQDPDLLIRTSGEIRLSNFMLWQLAYTEFWFTDVLWPDFSEEHLIQAIEEFQNRQRRFGGV